MLQQVDHYTSLARAVARLPRDSYEARGVVYDRALAALARRLYSVDPPLSKADVDMELLAFREAVRRVEFADLDYSPPPRVRYQDAPPIAPWHARGRANQRVAARGRSRSVRGRVMRRGILAGLLIGLGIAGYSHVKGQIDLSPLARRLNGVAANGLARVIASDPPAEHDAAPAVPERAVYYEGTGAASRQLAAEALWQTRIEAAGPGQKQDAVLSVDVPLSERGFSFTMSIRRDARAPSAMGHLVELKFAPTKDFVVERITGLKGISVRSADDRSATALSGNSIKLAPGVFQFRFPASREGARRNAELLRTQPRLDIAIVFANGTIGILSIDKGASGERAFKQAFHRWTQ